MGLKNYLLAQSKNFSYEGETSDVISANTETQFIKELEMYLIKLCKNSNSAVLQKTRKKYTVH